MRGQADGASALWRRLDMPGHDACRLERYAAGWRLRGGAAFLHEGEAAGLGYIIECDSAWNSIGGRVTGFIGDREIAWAVTRQGDCWRLNGAAVPGLEHLRDLDLSFSPSTNFLQLRRARLAIGESAELPAAWLELESGTLRELPQRYERRDETSYGYESPRTGYAGLLEMLPNGLVRRYPGLWEAVE
jgi:hypothetical protein